MILPSHNIRPQILIEKYDNCGILIEERELDTKYEANSFITTQKYSDKNELIKEEKFPVRSYIGNYINAFMAGLSGSRLDYTQSNGSTSNYIPISQFNRFAASIPINNVTVGILAGKNVDGISTISSDSASFTDYNLKNPIENGYVSGTLFYGDSLYKNLYISESFSVISYSRIFSNLSTSSINIKERNAEVIKVNEYFEGKVKSFVIESGEGSQTVGVIKPGDYEFNTDLSEVMTVVFGKISVYYPEYNEWEDFERGSSFSVPAKSVLKITVEQDSAYLCEYGI